MTVSDSTMLLHMETPHSDRQDGSREDLTIAPCPVCGFDMNAVRGSKDAVCVNCGFKDSCCY
ncbi:MAG: hypothetical protein NVS2B16_19430 [Chloroflexota bacterium]